MGSANGPFACLDFGGTGNGGQNFPLGKCPTIEVQPRSSQFLS